MAKKKKNKASPKRKGMIKKLSDKLSKRKHGGGGDGGSDDGGTTQEAGVTCACFGGCGVSSNCSNCQGPKG